MTVTPPNLADLIDFPAIILDMDIGIEAEVDIQYRCKSCSELMAPKDAVLADGHAWHPEHAPGEDRP